MPTPPLRLPLSGSNGHVRGAAPLAARPSTGRPPTSRPALQRKPVACSGCPLESRGAGFVPPDGPEGAPILLFAEAPGYDEAVLGRPMVGAAGSMLERILRRNHRNRGEFRINNTVACTPPQNQLRNTPYFLQAVEHCRVHSEPVLNEGHPVVMALGLTALERTLNLIGQPRIRMEDWHGTVTRDPEDRFWVVPSYHPSFLQRGAHNLMGVVSFDLQVALEVAAGTWTPQPIETVIDPPLDWFVAYVLAYEAAARQDPGGVALACDMETPDKAHKAENELGPDDRSYQITRWNFSYHPDQGVTVPEHPAFRPWIARLLAAGGLHYWWNGSGYDWDRTLAAGYQLTLLDQADLMLGAHVLQSDIPLGLGFWAPFYSRYGAWKHLSETDPELYACIDGPQTYRTGGGVIADLIQAGQWEAFYDHCHRLFHDVLKPAQQIGVLIDRPALQAFHDDLAAHLRRLSHQMQAVVPEALRPLTHETKTPPAEGILHPEARTHTLKGAEKKDPPDPIKQELYAQVAVSVVREVPRTLQICTTCGAEDVHRKHRCKDASGKPDRTVEPALELVERIVPRYFWQEPFNPDSPQQILAYIAHRGHTPGKTKVSKADSADRETLIRLARSTKDPLYQLLLDYRSVKKVDSTYAVPTLRRVAEDPEGRIHPIPTFRPSTSRLSYISPNITNVVADKGGKSERTNLAAGFRRCVIAAPGCRLLEMDFAGIEAVLTGWFARDPVYVRLARLGVHAYLTTHLIKKPADLSWSDADLSALFSAVKKAHPHTYDAAKRNVHGTNYGLTPYGMAQTFPDLYADVKAAERVQETYFEICPSLPTWHQGLQQRAYDVGWLGGDGPPLMAETNDCYKRGWTGPSPWTHPYHYRHWFWSVIAYRPINEAQRIRRQKQGKISVEINGRWFGVERGEDSKRVIAFYPQSTAAGILKRSMLALFSDPDHPSYIGDAYYGRTPLRAPIHDSLLLEVPDGEWDRVLECVAREMLRPVAELPLPPAWGMGDYLSIEVDGKAGRNWKDVEGVTLPTRAELGLVAGQVGAVGGSPLAGEETFFGTEEGDEEDVMDLRVSA